MDAWTDRNSELGPVFKFLLECSFETSMYKTQRAMKGQWYISPLPVVPVGVAVRGDLEEAEWDHYGCAEFEVYSHFHPTLWLD